MRGTRDGSRWPVDSIPSSRREAEAYRGVRRAAVSVPANIAEGFKRRGQADKVRFYNTAEASLEELKYYFILAKDLEYLAEAEPLLAEAETVSRMLYRLIESVDRKR